MIIDQTSYSEPWETAFKILIFSLWRRQSLISPDRPIFDRRKTGLATESGRQMASACIAAGKRHLRY
jgi:hypothetical protein